MSRSAIEINAQISNTFFSCSFIGRSLIFRLFRVRIKIRADDVDVYRFICVLIKCGRVTSGISVFIRSDTSITRFIFVQRRKWNGDNERFVKSRCIWMAEFDHPHSYFSVVLLLFASILCYCTAQMYDPNYTTTSYHDGPANETDVDYQPGGRYNHGNGRPGCRTPPEFERRWRNNWDPKRYWLCTQSGAISHVCGTELMYSDRQQCCIHWSQWVWSPPFDPPTHG